MDERVDRLRELRAAQRGRRIHLLPELSHRFHGRRVVAVGRQQVGCIVRTANRHGYEVDRQEDVDGFLNEHGRVCMAFGDLAQFAEDSGIDLGRQFAEVFTQLFRGFVGDRAWFDSAEVNREARIRAFEAGKKAPLLRVQRRVELLVDLTDVVTGRDPFARTEQFLGDLPSVEARAIFYIHVAKRVIPVVPIDENYGTVRHDRSQKNPGVWWVPDTGG